MTDKVTRSGLQCSPAAERNRDPILAVLKRVLLPDGDILEIASGSGQHGAYFAPRLPDHTWRPSDPERENRASIAEWVRESGADNLRPPMDLDVTADLWPPEREQISIKAVVCINMIHIAPWAAAMGLMAGAGRILAPGGVLYLYGPYRVEGHPTAPSNEEFDASLRRRNREWGLKFLPDVIELAQSRGLEHVETVDMPANNLSVVFQKS